MDSGSAWCQHLRAWVSTRGGKLPRWPASPPTQRLRNWPRYSAHCLMTR